MTGTNRNWSTGDPDEVYGSVRVVDVVRAIRDLDSGFYPMEEVKRLYVQVAGSSSGHDLGHVSAVMTRFGLVAHTQDYQRGWRIDPEWLAARWPRLPWTD